MTNKALIFDSSSIITLALNDLLYILKPLKEKFGGEFYISEDIKREVIDKSVEIRRFMLEALMIKKLINDGTFKVVQAKDYKKEKDEIMNKANFTFKTEEDWIRIIHDGEASCLALYKTIKADKKAIVIDERTTRMLVEMPENLHRLLGKKLHTKIQAKQENYSFFKGINLIRSSELSLIAYMSKILTLPTESKEAITAILYAAKYKGCSISNQEIEQIKNIKV